MGRLNEQKLQALLKENKPVVVAVGDGSGLSLRITPTGASWQLRYRHAAKAHWLTIGKYPGCSLRDAQKRTTKERARIDDGVDPVAEKRRTRLALKAAKTFRDLAADLRPAFDALWNAIGYAQSQFFNADGRWVGPH